MAVATMKSTVHLAMGESLRRCWMASVTILFLLHRVAGQTTTEFLEDLSVYFREHHRGMDLTIAQFRQLLKRLTAILVVSGEYAEGHEHLVGMQTGILATQIIDLCLLYRLNETLRNELGLVVNAGEIFHGIDQERGATTQ